MKRIISVFIALILILSTLAACGKSSSAGKSFAMPVSLTPECIDPQIASSDTEKLIVYNCFEGLLRLSNGGKIENGVAESYEISTDLLTYTFHLRKDAKWHILSDYEDFLGDKFESKYDFSVTANDFVFGLKRALSPETKAADAVLLYAIKNAQSVAAGKMSADTLNVKAIDDYTLEIKLSYPDSNFLYALTKPVAMPCNEAFWTATQGKYGLSITYTLFNGPFYVSKWNDGESVRLGKNEDYTGLNKVNPASVWLYVNTDEQSIAEKCAAGSYDVAFLNENQLSSIDKTALSVHTFENTACSLVFNCSDKNFKCTDARKALCYALDTSSLNLPVNISSFASGIVPPYCTLGENSYREKAGRANILSFNASSAVNKFNSALTELDISVLQFTILCPESYESTVRLILQGWQKTLGIKLVASVEVKPMNEVLSSVQSGNYSVAFYPLTASEQDAETYLSTFVSTSGDNILRFCDTAYDSLFAKSRSSGNKNDLIKAENYLLEIAVISPLFNQNSYFVTAGNTNNIYFCSGKQSVFFISAEKSE